MGRLIAGNNHTTKTTPYQGAANAHQKRTVLSPACKEWQGFFGIGCRSDRFKASPHSAKKQEHVQNKTFSFPLSDLLPKILARPRRGTITDSEANRRIARLGRINIHNLSPFVRECDVFFGTWNVALAVRTLITCNISCVNLDGIGHVIFPRSMADGFPKVLQLRSRFLY